MSRRGMTLLEVMVALVILGLVVASYLELFGGALRGAGAAQTWSQAVAYATDGMERVKLDPNPSALAGAVEPLPGGFARRYEIRSWSAPGVDGAFAELRVIVTIPAGGQYALERLVRAR
jgi:prepilin-type N-terminal cleavage/methylation domain-containing protein